MSILRRSVMVGAAILSFSTFATAACDGFYVGGQLGRTYTNYGHTEAGLTSTTSISKGGLGGRVYGGYQFDQNWAMELGYTSYASTTFNGMNGGATNGSLNLSAIDLSGKATLPFSNGWGAYGKLGVARSYARPNGALTALSTKLNSNKSRTHLVWGVGVNYEANQNLTVDASWTRLQNRDVVTNASLLGLGVAYHFG